jgi:histidine triad (HIT) family protein
MPTGSDCIFCRIVAGEIPANRVFEDDASLAFLDIAPLSDGHLLLVPKQHFDRLDQMPADLVARVCANLPKLGAALCGAVSCAGYNVLQNNGAVAGQAVGHVHFHLIGRNAADGLGYRWNAGNYPEGQAEKLHEQLRKALEE